MGEVDIKVVKEFFEKNKDSEDVKGYIKGFYTTDGVSGFLESDEGKKILQSRLDSHFTKGLETWKTNNLKKILDDEVDKVVKERYPSETEEQKRLKQLEKEIAEEKSARKKSDLSNLAMREATSKGLPVDLISYFVQSDDVTTKEAITKYEKAWTETLNKAVDERMKKFGRKIDDNPEPEKGLFTRDEVAKMSQIEVKANYEKIKKSQKYW